MPVLVTGAGGFAGGHVARRLAEAGFEVVALTRRSPVTPPEAPAAARRFAVVSTDLERPESLPRSVDAVVHAAATSIWTGVTVERMIADNVVATRALARFALDARARVLVFFSSMSAFGRISAPVADETLPVVDPDAYGVTKLLGEQLLAEVARSLPSLAIRLPAVIGRGSRRNWPSECLRKLKAGEPLEFFNPDAGYNNAVHEEDLARLIAGVLREGLHGHDMIVLGADGQTRLARVVEMLVAGTGSASRITVVERSRQAFLIDSSKARRRYGYAPMPIEPMIERFIADNKGL